MTVWILFIWYTSGTPQPSGFAYESERTCLEAGESYKRTVCLKVFVPRPK